MDILEEKIMEMIRQKGTDGHEEYQRRINRLDLVNALSAEGLDKTEAEAALEKLCLSGVLAMDETGVYQYDEPPSA